MYNFVGLVIITLVPLCVLMTIIATIYGLNYHDNSILTCMSDIRGNKSHEMKYRIQLLGSPGGPSGLRSTGTRGISGEFSR
ncbi:hypothetical protein SAMN05421752_11250 [Natronorubrum thiooxidans]|uniref:Uncharacterized protein n=1 Tax=Natronorubrum thiooxidans TaxID=308853 RepID=A0A1N7GH85_9EURY|nr:hypothetical protein SAMN05421752_11250 [Natronorubrum thiooxidans]